MPRKSKIIQVSFWMVLAFAYVQTAEAQEMSPMQVVETFCKLDAAAKQLNLGGQKDLRALFLDARSLNGHSEVTVVKDYAVRDLGVRNGIAEFVIHYGVLGRIDSSLHFTRLQTAYSKQPLLSAEGIFLVRSDTFFELGNDGEWQQMRGPLQWRIKAVPSEPHLSIGAAIGYVRRMGYRPKNPGLKMNAQQTLAQLQELYQSQFLPAGLAQPVQQSPTSVLATFVTMATDGAGLNPEGRKQLDAFLVHPVQSLPEKIHVAKSYSVTDGAISGNQADLYVDYGAIGDLDSSFSFTSTALPGNPIGNVIQQKFKLILDNKYAVPTAPGAPQREVIGPSRWRIEEAAREYWLTVKAAIRHVKQMRDSTTNPGIKTNAEKTLAALEKYR